MKNEMQFFMCKRVDNEKLEAYGFTRDSNTFCYRTKLLDGQFLMEVYIDNGEVQTRTLDIKNECEYTLHVVRGAQGEFVGEVRTAYGNVLSDIRSKCFIDDVFKSNGASKILNKSPCSCP